ncbi:hypothetical protein [Spirosoma luteum]|uniref:hypothetical protein n=1 Tax=Spirosoma luteum TaxID=431553 RepID=UPI00037FE736|nr:hypothetical protein [Spirosoma luteum]
MKTPFHTRLICCWLALVVLLSSTGFGMIDHWCQMRGHSKALLLTEKGCVVNPCQTDEPTAPVTGGPLVKKMPCCKTTVSFEHLDVSRLVADHPSLATPQPADFILNPQFRLLLAELMPTDSQPSVPSIANDPIYRTGRFRLTVGCSWLI